MISSMARAFSKLGPSPSFGFGPGAKVNPNEGGPGSGPQKGEGGEGNDHHRGARIYKSGNAVRALTPSGHNIGPYKNADLLKSHLDKNDSSFGLGKKEAVSATTQTAQLKATKKTKESNKKNHSVSIRESQNPKVKQNGSLFEVILIEEGLGNFKDRFYYTKQALQNAVESKLFEGAQSYADHPSMIEEESRPERSTRDILGYYENVRYQESDEGRGQLIANFSISQAASFDWARDLLSNAIGYAEKFPTLELVGLSINANGTAVPSSIDEFLSSEKLAASVVEKLQQAKAQGIDEINIVNELKEAQSVDLVTKAGAGGRILKMLEQEKKMIRKKRNFREASEVESEETEGGAPAQGDGATDDHADADQDKALFAKMIKQYLGKDDADAEEMEVAQHAHEAAKEMGMEGKEAYEAAGQHLKMAMAVGKKMAQKQADKAETTESGDKEESESEESESESHHESKEDGCSPIAKKGEQKAPTKAGTPTNGKTQESMKKIVELSGEVAKLRESVRVFQMRDYLEAKLKESGKSKVVTTKFREALGVPKSKEQIDSTWKVFIKAYEAGAEEVSSDFSEGMFSERSMFRESIGESKRKSGFEDCLR